MHENDNLQREMEKLNSRIKILKENSSTLSQTLNETQQELESLVNEHEKLSEDYQRAKGKLAKLEDEREHYLNINNENEGELN